MMRRRSDAMAYGKFGAVGNLTEALLTRKIIHIHSSSLTRRTKSPAQYVPSPLSFAKPGNCVN